MNKVKWGALAIASLLVVITSWGKLDISKGRMLMCQDMVTKYHVKYTGEFQIIRGVLYCKHPNTNSYNKWRGYYYENTRKDQ